jgi:signal transduction histidine kinase
MAPRTILRSITQSPRLLLITAILLIVFVTIIDRITGPELSASIFYLLPVSLVAWFINRRFGLVFAVTGAIFWLLTDLATNPTGSHPLIPFWNALVRLGFFLIVVWSLTSLRRTREKENDLMSFVVHDLRAPLGNMLTALDLLQKEAEATKSENSIELVDISLTSGRRMLLLVNSLLDLARLEGGKMPVIKQPVALLDVFNKANNMVSIMAKYKNISIVYGEGVSQVSATADPNLTERVLVNLISNAIKFTPKDGHIYLSADLQPNKQVLIGIRDDGPSIPIEFEKQIFSRFGQLKGHKTDGNIGTGLGLAFCKLAVEAQNGRIWLEPNDGRGTLIHFTLPASEVIG